MVKTQGCGSCIRGFESHYPPHKISVKAEQFMMLGYREVVRQRILIPSFAGSNPATLVKKSLIYRLFFYLVEPKKALFLFLLRILKDLLQPCNGISIDSLLEYD